MSMTKIEKVKPKKEKAEVVSSVDEGHYPWGTEITLRDELLSSVGIDAAVGDEVQIVATARVTQRTENTNESEKGRNKKTKSMDFQLTSINVSSGKAKDRVNEMYEDGES